MKERFESECLGHGSSAEQAADIIRRRNEDGSGMDRQDGALHSDSEYELAFRARTFSHAICALAAALAMSQKHACERIIRS